MATALAFNSCKPAEEDDIFDKSAAERLNEASDLYSKRLMASPNGWAMQLYPTTENEYPYGSGYLLLCRFNKDFSVNVSMNNVFTENKYMATVVHSAVLGKKVLYVKGAPEIILSLSSIDNATRDNTLNTLHGYQKKAMRTLALAYAIVDDQDNIFSDGKLTSDNLTLAGVFAIADDIRDGVKESITECINAGIAVKIVTDDNADTAVEIGRKIGL